MKKIICPNQAREILETGNLRFVNGPHSDRSTALDTKLKRLARDGQTPFATFLTCSDSRVPVELIFDCDVGDLFVIRVAGNIAEPSQIASIEYACAYLGTPLVVVMGHTGCGAIQAAFAERNAPLPTSSPHLSSLLKHLHPAIENVEKTQHVCASEIFDRACLENVKHSLKLIERKSEIIATRVASGSLCLLGAIYDIASGVVTFHSQADEHFSSVLLNDDNVSTLGVQS